MLANFPNFAGIYPLTSDFCIELLPDRTVFEELLHFACFYIEIIDVHFQFLHDATVNLDIVRNEARFEDVNNLEHFMMKLVQGYFFFVENQSNYLPSFVLESILLLDEVMNTLRTF